MTVICVDFDGTLHDPYNREPGYRMGTPVDGAKEGLRRLKLAGHKVVVCTVRPDVKHVEDWLRYFGMLRYIDQVTHEKPQADVYVDDKALRFDGVWAHTVEAVNVFLRRR